MNSGDVTKFSYIPRIHIFSWRLAWLAKTPVFGYQGANVVGPEISRMAMEALFLALLISSPVMLVSVVVGLIVAVIQAITQVQEQTLSFVPKLVAVSIVLAAAGGWMASELVRFTYAAWSRLPEYML